MQPTAWDDYLIHQVAEPMDTLGTTEENFMDRLWFMTYSRDGSVQLMAGLGVHPNKGLMDAFLLIRKDGVQHNFRAYRHVDGDKSVPTIGPLSFEVVVPQEHWRLKLEDNDTGIGCALDFHGRVAPFLFPRLGFKAQEQLHYKQPGVCTGTLTVGGEVIPIVDAPAVRDRSWGARSSGLVASLETLVVVEAHFASTSATLIYLDSEHFEMRQGAVLGDDGSVIPIVQMRQHVEFDRGQIFAAAHLELEAESGRVWQLSAKAIGEPCYFSGGGYDGRHGIDRGPFLLEGEQWDVTAGGNVSTVFPYYSRIVELSLDGEPGIGHVEAFFSQEPDWEYRSTLPTERGGDR